MRIHLIGIGGTGMGALAGLLVADEHEVRGSDGPIYPPMSDQLGALGIPVASSYAPENLDWNPEIVVVGNTCKSDNPEVVAAQERGFELSSLPAMIRQMVIRDRRSLVVAGTHGKTTTSSLLAHILLENGRDPGIFIGGVPLNLGRGWHAGKGGDVVLEGDEYGSAFFDKRSKFLHYQPTCAILTSVELDHVDIFESMDAVRDTFREFVKSIPEDGQLLVAASSEEAQAIAKDGLVTPETYGVAKDPAASSLDWCAAEISLNEAGRCSFAVWHQGESIGSFEMLLSGRQNVEDALASIALCLSLGLSVEEIGRAVSSFSGVARRQQFRGMAQGVTLIEDYGHHPSAIALTLEGLHARFSGRRVLAVYEPRTATSRRDTFQNEFVEAFANADELIVGELYAPEAIPEDERFDPAKLALEVHKCGTPAVCIRDVDGIVKHVVDNARPGDVVVIFTTGAFNNIFSRLGKAFGDALIPATRAHTADICKLLEELELPYDDVDEDKMRDFYVLENENGVIGTVALEVFGEEAVLRSLGVAPSGRGIGYGWMLADLVIQQARFRGVRRLYLVTEKASDFFAAKHGFRIVDLSTVPPVVAGSTPFASNADGMVPMRLDLNRA